VPFRNVLGTKLSELLYLKFPYLKMTIRLSKRFLKCLGWFDTTTRSSLGGLNMNLMARDEDGSPDAGPGDSLSGSVL
jgi:hypothetical protein